MRAVQDFFGGLETFIGTPSTDVRNAMEREHISEEPFSSHNVSNTSLRAEWLYVTTMEVGERADRQQDFTLQRPGWRLSNFVQH